MPSPVDRVAAAAQTVRPLRLFLSLVAAPFYVVGYAAGILFVALTWVLAALQVGVADARTRRTGGPDGPS